MDSESREHIWYRLAQTALALLVLYSLYLSFTRIYQVDEVQNIFMARVTALGRQRQYYTNGSLVLLGPLSWIVGYAKSSEGMFTGARLLFFGLYWLNLALIPAIAGFALRSRAYLFTLLLVAALPPMLDYGLEIRHDNVLLTLLLLFWVVPRRFKGPGWVAFLFLGALSGIMQFTAFKSFLFWMPLSVGLLVFPPARFKIAWAKRAMAWIAGSAFAALIIRILYGTHGAWEAYVNGVSTAFGQSNGPIRFAPWTTMVRLLDQTPLFLALGAMAAIRLVLRTRAEGWRSLGWEGSGPEAFLFLLTVLAILANPVPYPYNLLHLVPFLFLWLVKAQGDPGVEALPASLLTQQLQPLLAGVFIFCHIIPFTKSAYRHIEWSNERQHLLMDTTELLTDPEKDRVFDASGLVASRESVGYQWFLHTLVMERFRNGTLEPLWKQFAANPPEVVLRNYRTDWMGSEDQRFLSDHYLPLADDILVLGRVLPPGGGTFDCLHTGRYELDILDPKGSMPSTGAIWVDGQPYKTGSILSLGAGARAMRTLGQSRIQVVWLGPKLPLMPRMPNQDHHLLFVNWY